MGRKRRTRVAEADQSRLSRKHIMEGWTPAYGGSATITSMSWETTGIPMGARDRRSRGRRLAGGAACRRSS